MESLVLISELLKIGIQWKLIVVLMRELENPDWSEVVPLS